MPSNRTKTDAAFQALRLRRREALRWAGVSGIAGVLSGACARSAGAAEGSARGAQGQDAFDLRPGQPGSCAETPAQTEGPYFLGDRPERADLRYRDPGPSQPEVGAAASESSDAESSGSEPRRARPGAERRRERIPGVELDLELRVVRLGAGLCAPLVGATVDIWHCDALGVYSGVEDLSRSGSRDRGSRAPGFLRGVQRVDDEGRVRFRTIYPGWYPGRAVHIHFKVVRFEGGSRSRPLEFTSQLYFDDEVTREVHREDPYLRRGDPPLNRRDGIYRYGGDRLLLSPVREGAGYVARFEVGLRET